MFSKAEMIAVQTCVLPHAGAPLSEYLFTAYRQTPQYLGQADSMDIVQENGVQLAMDVTLTHRRANVDVEC